MSVPAIVLDAGGDAGARARTVQSLAAQSVQLSVHASLSDVVESPGGVLLFVLAGVELDHTAVERATWFLASRPSLTCVTGASAVAPADAGVLGCAVQFMAIRLDAARRMLGTSAVALHASTGVALMIGARRQTGIGAGWISEPLISTKADVSLCAQLCADLRAALTQLSMDEAALMDAASTRPPVVPLQHLMNVATPALQVSRQPSSGLRVLALLQGFPMGGYTAFNADLLPRLAAAGHAVTTCTTEWWRTDWRLDQVRAVAPDIHHAQSIVPPAAVPAYVDWLITSRAIEVVLLSHSHLGYHMLPYLRARHPNVAFVDYVHTDWFETGMYGSYAAMSARWEGELDAQLATSRALADQLIGNGCAVDALRVAHIGIDTAMWQRDDAHGTDVRTAIGADASTVVLLFSGRVSPEKRPHLAVDVLAELCAAGHDLRLVIAGDGPMLPSVHALANARGIADRVHLLGELDEQMLRQVYSAADIFIAPSEIEGIARSLYEAMAMGCIPVVSDVGGQRELVVAGTGSLVDASGNDAAPYSDGVRPWLDPSARVRASAAARAHIVAHFDASRTVGIVTDTLHLAQERRRARQAVLPPAIADELAVLSIEVTRRHVLQAAGR